MNRMYRNNLHMKQNNKIILEDISFFILNLLLSPYLFIPLRPGVLVSVDL